MRAWMKAGRPFSIQKDRPEKETFPFAPSGGDCLFVLSCNDHHLRVALMADFTNF